MGEHSAFSLAGRTALITGAGSGLGYAMAKCMIISGAKVILVGRRRDVLETAAAEIGSAAHPEVFDVTEVGKIPAFITRMEQEYGGIDILVNNAGIHCKKPVEETTNDDFNGVLGTHLVSSFALSKAVVPGMKHRTRGSILFISSMAAFLGMPSVVAYSAAKAGMTGMMRSMASELGGAGIRVNAIAPGFIETPMLRKAINGDQPRIDKILGRTPTHTFGDPDDIGWAATYLASDAAKFVNGHVLVVDGGALIGF